MFNFSPKISCKIHLLHKNRKKQKKALTNPIECAIMYELSRNLGVAQLVARYLGVVEAASSSLVTQTRKSIENSRFLCFFLLFLAVFHTFLCKTASSIMPMTTITTTIDFLRLNKGERKFNTFFGQSSGILTL